ncbi:MAG: hypothetical protein ACYCU3_15260, partial [Streptosporangiaceae bacterium]
GGAQAGPAEVRRTPSRGAQAGPAKVGCAAAGADPAAAVIGPVRRGSGFRQLAARQSGQDVPEPAWPAAG